tara:strand:- start:785 stop:2023 length:1239 start_codon:yes stop_codon:yes gene_type:complete
MITDNLNPNTIPDLFSEKYYENFSSKHSWEPGWLADFRSVSWATLKENQNLNIKDEHWRFSPKNRFRFTNFENISESSNSIKLDRSSNSAEYVLNTVDNLLLENPELIAEFTGNRGPNLGATESFHLTNTYFNNGFFLRVSENQKQTLRIEHTCPAKGHVAFHKNYVLLEDLAEVTLIENFDSKNNTFQGGLSNLTHFKIGKGAKLTRILIQNMAIGSTFHNLENFDLHQDSSVVNVECFLGSEQSRIETKGNLLESGANFENFSFVSGRNRQLFDQRTEQHHLASHCSSNLLSKNLLQNEAKSIFAGMIKVDPVAQQTNALQTNRNLLLSKEAEANSLPGLEILANDVRCTHGATTSRLDQEELFYLLSRGIDKKSAESLISLGFIEEIIAKINDENLIQKIRDLVCNHFR